MPLRDAWRSGPSFCAENETTKKKFPAATEGCMSVMPIGVTSRVHVKWDTGKWGRRWNQLTFDIKELCLSNFEEYKITCQIIAHTNPTSSMHYAWQHKFPCEIFPKALGQERYYKKQWNSRDVRRLSVSIPAVPINSWMLLSSPCHVGRLPFSTILLSDSV